MIARSARRSAIPTALSPSNLGDGAWSSSLWALQARWHCAVPRLSTQANHQHTRSVFQPDTTGRLL